MKETGLDFQIYSLRHTFASRMASAGMPVHILQKFLGHSSTRMLDKYVHPSEEEMRRWIQK